MKLDRLLIDKIENRILVGTIAFVGIMVVIGWIVINEPARMAAFSAQYEGRAIERGAYLYNQNCSTCHGIDGRGLAGRAPGLNSPHLFGFDFLAAQRRDLDRIERESRAPLLLVEEYDDLTAAIAEGTLEGEELTAAEARVAELESQVADAQATLDDLDAQRVAVEEEMAGIESQMADAIASGYTPDEPERTKQVGWEGSIRSYIYTTLVHGRPGSQNYWPTGEGMAAWGQVAGGPLRDDQLDDLTKYIMNWDKGSNWSMDDLNSVGQFAIISLNPNDVPTVASDGAAVPVVGNDVEEILAGLADYTGDPVNGQTIYNGKYACAGCHGNAVVAPLTELTWTSAVNGDRGEEYAADPVFYIVQSVTHPGDYVVDGYPAGAMPANFGERVTYQEMADIIAYVSSYDG